MQLPADAEIHAKAAEMGLLDPDGSIDSQSRKTVVQALLDDQQQKKSEPETRELLTRTVTQVSSGSLVVELWHVPKGTAQ